MSRRRRIGGIVILLATLGACAATDEAASRSASDSHGRSATAEIDRRAVGEPMVDADRLLVSGAARAAADGFPSLSGDRVGLIAHSASTVGGVHTADLLAADPDVELVALFGPEHGIRSDVGAGIDVADAIDEATGVPVYSLYGERRAPTAELVEGLDELVYDLQDVGTRYYTYISTMGLAMQVAAEAGIGFTVFDRPNPHGSRIAGSVLRSGYESFVGQYPIAELYGLTPGELATAIVGERWLPGLDDLDLRVVELAGWSGTAVRPGSEVGWRPPSPAIVDAETALVYPAVVLFEATSLSFGRGTDLPYRLVGSPDLDADAVAAELNGIGLAGVTFEPVVVAVQSSPDDRISHAHAGTDIRAVRLIVTDPMTFRPTETGVHLLTTIVERMGLEAIARPEWLDQLSGSTELRTAVQAGLPAEEIIADRTPRLVAFEAVIDRYRRYDGR